MCRIRTRRVRSTLTENLAENRLKSRPKVNTIIGEIRYTLRSAVLSEVEMRTRRIEVNDLMQQGYVYLLTEPAGRNFHAGFRPELTPKQMLRLGVFGGRYMTDCAAEYPADWFARARLCHERHDPDLNFFEVNASQPLAVWRAKGWIYHEDPRGWFQWYCRYFLGRRSADDERQIKRWHAIRRHIGQLQKNCRLGDLDCRRKQRQSLLHWAYDSRRI